MKTCIFINGTNCVGKSTLAKELIARFGGIGSVSRTLTSCKNGLVCFAGRYDLTKRYGGVDGFNSTKVLADVVLEGLQAHEVIVCEGSYFHTIGLNLTNAMFEAEQHLVVYLYAPVDTLNARLLERGGKPLTPVMASKQKQCLVAARKWAAMGVPVLTYDTSKIAPPNIATEVISKIEQLCGENLTIR